jgi:autotransporter family porin
VDASANVDPTPASRSFTVATTTPTAAKATTRPVGSAPLSDTDAGARVTRSGYEPRPGNATYNRRLPSSSELSAFRSEYRYVLSGLLVDNVTGNFSGTTDEIIQWTAHKWGFDEDVFRAAAAVESWWDQSLIGDNGASPGLFQLKTQRYPTTYMLARDSTSFNADLYGAMMRYYYDGKATWLNDPCCFSGTTYVAGDLWGTIGAHYSGRWYNTGANTYIANVKDYLARRIWEQPGF